MKIGFHSNTKGAAVKRFLPTMRYCAAAAIFLFGLGAAVSAQSENKTPSTPQTEPAKSALTYVIPIRGDINKSMLYIVRRGIKEAQEKKADSIIIHMDTNGGELQSAIDIIKIINKFEPANGRYTLVDNRAISAGAYIASSTRHIYMTPGSVIGALTPIMMGPNGPAEMSEAISEKMSSAVRALVRANAEQNGHNTHVFDAMVDRNQGLIVEGVEVVPKGKIVTLTTKEATQTYGKPPRPLLASGTVENLEGLISKIQSSGGKTVTIEATGFEKVATFLTTIAPLLMTAALILGYIEFKTPGFGIFGIGAVICGILFFFGHYIAGLSGYENLLIFMVGVLLILGELLILPGTLALGLSGVALIFFSLLRAMADMWPKDGYLPSTSQLHAPLINLGITFALSGIAIALFAKFLPESSIGRKLTLQTTSPSPISIEETDIPVGLTGECISPLRPVGVAVFGEKRLDVLTEGDYIATGSRVKVIRTEGSKIVVEKV